MFDKLCEFYKLHAIPYFQNINNVPASSVWLFILLGIMCWNI
jgi:hypothetical protein